MVKGKRQKLLRSLLMTGSVFEVIFSDSVTRLVTKGNDSNGMLENGYKEFQRPRSRSLYTTSHGYSNDDVSSRDSGKYEGTLWPPYVPKPITVKNYYPDDFNVSL